MASNWIFSKEVAEVYFADMNWLCLEDFVIRIY